MCSGGIQDSGSRPAISSSRRWRASARSFFARFLFPRMAAVSAGSARCTRRRPLELLDHEPPARRRLQRDLELLASEARQEPAHTDAVGRCDPRPRDLAGRGVDPVGGDLRSMLVKSH